jgi:raffinose/stachyose/melibiose transport system substrate-binding protein
MAKKHVLGALAAAFALSAIVFTSASVAGPTATKADDPNNANLTYWYWGEDDAPGATNWIKSEISQYEKAHPKVKITLAVQSTDTLISAFTTAAQTKSGPDIATQWATLPVLTPAWNGWSVPISQ